MVMESDVILDLLQYAGKQMEGKVEYWDALFDRQSSCTISKDNVDERIALPELAGIQLRSFKNGVWRSASTYKMEKARLKELALKLVRLRQETKNRVRLREQKPSKLDVVMRVGKNPSDVSLESKVDDIRSFRKAATGVDKRIINITVQYGDSILFHS
jgi:predicted Zn-dependent protease